MADYDGDIKLKVSVSTEDLQKELQGIKEEFRKAMDPSNFSGVTEGLEKLQSSFDNLAQKIDSVADHLQSMSGTSVSSVELENFHNQLGQISESVTNVKSNIQSMGQTSQQSAKGFEQASSSVKQMQDVIQQADHSMDGMLESINEAQVANSRFNGTLADTVNEANALRKSIDDAFSSGALDDMSAKTQRARMNLDSLYEKSDELQRKLMEMAQQKAPTEEYAQLQQDLEGVLRTQEEVNKAILRMEESVNFDPLDKKYQNLQKHANDIKIDIQMIIADMDILEEEGKAFTDAFADPEGVKKLQKELNVVNDKIKLQMNGLNNNKKATISWKDELKKVGKLMKDLLTTTGKLASKIGSGIVSGFKKIASSIAEAGSKGVTSFAHLTRSILLAGIGVQGLMSLFRKLRTEIISGMTAAINSVSSIKSSFESLQSSITNLKAQLSMAFLPLVEIAIPYVQQLCSWFTNLINLVSQFIAALSGASTWRRVTGVTSGGGGGSAKSKEEQQAKKQAAYEKKVADAYAKADKEEARVNERNAKALERYQKAQEKAADADKKRLSGLDILNNMTTQQTELEEPELEEFDKQAYLQELLDAIGEMEDAMDDLGGAGAGTIEWVEEAIDSKIKDLIDWLKDMWEKGDFTKLGAKMGQQVKDWLDSIPWDKIQQTAGKLGKSVATLMNGWMEVQGLAYSIGKTAAEAINTGFTALNEFVHNFHFDSLGKYIAEKLNGLFENINWDLIKDTFVTGFHGLATSINSFIENFHWDNISNTISSLINALTAAVADFSTTVEWKELGQKIGEQIIKTIEKIDWKQAGAAVGATLQGLLDLVLEMIKYLKDHKEEVKKAFMDFWDGLAQELDFSDVASVIWGLFKVALILKLPAILGTVATTFWAIFKQQLLAKSIAGEIGGSVASKLGGGMAMETAGKTAAQSLFFGANSAWASLGGFSGIMTTDLATIGATTATEAGLIIGTGLVEGIVAFFGGAEAGKYIGEGIGELTEQINEAFGTDLNWDKEIYEQYKGIKGTCSLIADTVKATGDLIDMSSSGVDYSKYTENVIEKSGMRQFKAQIDELTKAYKQGEIDAESYNRNIQNLIKSSETWGNVCVDANGKVTKTGKEAQAQWDQMAQDMSPDILANHYANMAESITVSTKQSTEAVANNVEQANEQIKYSSQTVEDWYASQGKSKEYYESLSNTVEATTEKISSTSERLGINLDKVPTSVKEAIQKADAEAASSTKSLTDNINNGLAVENMPNVQNFGSNVEAAINSSLSSEANWTEMWGPMQTGFDEFWETFKTDIDTKIQEMLTALPETISANLDMTTALEPITTQVSEVLDTVETNITEKMGSISETITTTISELVTTLTTQMEEITNTITTEMTNMEQSFQQGWQGVVNTTQSAVQSMMRMISQLISQLRQVSSAINQTMTQMSNATSQMNSFGNNVVNTSNRLRSAQVPHMATGGVIPPSMAEHMIMVGDNNKETEVVSPLSTIKQAMMEVMAGMQSGSSEGDIVVQIDGREVFRAVREQSDQYKKRTGNTAFA